MHQLSTDVFLWLEKYKPELSETEIRTIETAMEIMERIEFGD